MKKTELKDYVKGWIIGDFEPSIMRDKEIEVCVKEYKKGYYEEFHHHKIAVEITCVVHGKVKMNGVDYYKGDIIKIEPGEGTDFRVLEDTINVVIKKPSVIGDKYIGRPE